MTDATYRERHPWPAPCLSARRMLAAAAILTGLALVTAAGCLTRGLSERDRSAALWMRTLTLSGPALGTPGSPMRHPEMVHPGIDLRFGIGTEIIP